ncbi:MAG: hypothetical protein KBT48_11495, partial [Firmicutes bacterium]|nr:hypothetical protein [Bacillota bacterium]
MKRLLVSLLFLSMIIGCSSSKQEEQVIEEKIEESETEDFLEEKESQEVAKEEFKPAQQEVVYPKEISMDQSVYNYVVNGQYRILERGETVFINRWNNRIETNMSEGAIPVFYKELTIGSPSIYDFMNMFEIEAGYA